MGTDGGALAFSLNPRVINPRSDVLDRAWKTIRVHRLFVAKAQNVRMELTVSPAVPEKSLADAHRLLQVLVNLLANALNSVPDGEPARSVVSMAATYDALAEQLRVEVRDNGAGMSAEGIQKIFRPFVEHMGGARRQPRSRHAPRRRSAASEPLA